MFPNQYVPIDAVDYPQGWVRRDLYDESYVPRGYPPVPQGKKAFPQFIKSLQQGAQNIRQSIDTDAQTTAQDPRHNPQRLQVGDQVYDANFSSSTAGFIGQLINFEMSFLSGSQRLPGVANSKALCANVKWILDREGQSVDQETLWMTSTGIIPVSTLRRANSNKQLKRARNNHSLSPPPSQQPLHAHDGQSDTSSNDKYEDEFDDI